LESFGRVGGKRSVAASGAESDHPRGIFAAQTRRPRNLERQFQPLP